MRNPGNTWDKKNKRHTCCGSKHTYHRSSCPNRMSAIPGRMSDPDFINVQSCKAEGYTSGQCAISLGMPLAQVNELWTL